MIIRLLEGFKGVVQEFGTPCRWRADRLVR